MAASKCQAFRRCASRRFAPGSVQRYRSAARVCRRGDSIKKIESSTYAGIPTGGRVIAFASDSSRTYDSSVDEGCVSVNEGDFAEVAGMRDGLQMTRCS